MLGGSQGDDSIIVSNKRQGCLDDLDFLVENKELESSISKTMQAKHKILGDMYSSAIDSVGDYYELALRNNGLGTQGKVREIKPD